MRYRPLARIPQPGRMYCQTPSSGWNTLLRLCNVETNRRSAWSRSALRSSSPMRPCAGTAVRGHRWVRETGVSFMQNDRNVIPWYLNGWALIGALIIFWPVGLLLVLGRVKTDRSFHGAAARSLQVAGWILTVTFGIVFLIGLIGLPSESNK